MMNKQKYQYALDWLEQFAGDVIGDNYSSIVWSGTVYTDQQLQDSYELHKRKHPLWVAFIAERNRLLQETDWWAVQDRTMTSDQRNYRQALRELPDNTDPLDGDIEWPVKPA